MVSHGPASSVQSSGRQELHTLLTTRSGWGIMIVTRPSAAVTPAMPAGLPLGFNGYLVATEPSVITYCRATTWVFMAFWTSASDSNSARPSPWATAMGSLDPAMSRRKMELELGTPTVHTRASNCSHLFRTKCGQSSAPGMSSLMLDIIWQPLQIPRANFDVSVKNALNCWRTSGLYRMHFAHPSPAPSTSPYEKPPQATTPRNPSSVTLPDNKSDM
mmetsp:Transcript_39813/g.71322  ORF Transcript_39813/g.71322 Transcript_39813/m.71322 type:complete len:217 (+) Transcript_39813:187-837(+)